MRILVLVLTVVLIVGMLLFLIPNYGTEVSIVIGTRVYQDVPVYLIVILTALVTILFVGVIAVAEGAQIRFDQRRLTKEIHQLETEINYFRTQPPPVERGSRTKDAKRDSEPAPPADRGAAGPAVPPSAPVYESEDEDRAGDDDDVYTGGRAV